MVYIKMRKLIYILFFFTLFSFSCRNGQKEKDIESNPEMETVKHSLLEIDKFNIETYSFVLKEWLEYYKEYSISLKDFEFHNQSLLLKISAQVDTFDFSNDIYEPFYKFSPNGLIALDLTSYNYPFKKDENNELVYLGGEPDSEVSIMDLKNKIRERLLFVGTVCVIEDAYWINNSQLLIVGQYNETGENKYQAVIWFVDLDKNIIQYFENKNIIKLKCDYLENTKYKDIKIMY